MCKLSTTAKKMRDDIYSGETCIADGVAEGTKFKIILTNETYEEPNVLFASTGGFGQHGFYNLGLFGGEIFENLLDLSRLKQPSVNFIELRAQAPLKAIVLSSIEGCDFYHDHFGYRGPIWRDYYYSMFYAGFTLLGNNFYRRMHAGSISARMYQSSEIKCAIEAFVHYAKATNHDDLELVLGGAAFFSYHYGGYDYLDKLSDLIKEVLNSHHKAIQLETSKEIGKFSREQARELNLQRLKVAVPVKVTKNFQYSSLVRH